MSGNDLGGRRRPPRADRARRELAFLHLLPCPRGPRIPPDLDRRGAVADAAHPHFIGGGGEGPQLEDDGAACAHAALGPREGRLLQALSVRPEDRILEIGTGSGYVTACLATLGSSVLSVDIHADFTETAQARLQAAGLHNVQLQTGDAARGWGNLRYDVIAITGALPVLDPLWRDLLTVSGRLFAVVGTAPIMEAILVTRVGEQEWTSESLFETELPCLLNSARPPVFTF